jgi:hypothetical protein
MIMQVSHIFDSKAGPGFSRNEIPGQSLSISLYL